MKLDVVDGQIRVSGGYFFKHSFYTVRAMLWGSAKATVGCMLDMALESAGLWHLAVWMSEGTLLGGAKGTTVDTCGSGEGMAQKASKTASAVRR